MYAVVSTTMKKCNAGFSSDILERLILRCDGNAGNSFLTTKGTYPSSRAQLGQAATADWGAERPRARRKWVESRVLFKEFSAGNQPRGSKEEL